MKCAQKPIAFFLLAWLSLTVTHGNVNSGEIDEAKLAYLDLFYKAAKIKEAIKALHKTYEEIELIKLEVNFENEQAFLYYYTCQENRVNGKHKATYVLSGEHWIPTGTVLLALVNGYKNVTGDDSLRKTNLIFQSFTVTDIANICSIVAKKLELDEKEILRLQNVSADLEGSGSITLSMQRNSRFVCLYRAEYTVLEDGRSYRIENITKIGVFQGPLSPETDEEDVRIYLLVPVQEGEKWGYLRSDGSWLTPPEYSWAYPFRNGLGIVKLKNLYGIIDINGHWVEQPVYERIVPLAGGIKAKRVGEEEFWYWKDPKFWDNRR